MYNLPGLETPQDLIDLGLGLVAGLLIAAVVLRTFRRTFFK